MNGKCFEIGTIQAFLDGETSPEATLRISDHLADCDACALLLADAEEETAAVFSVLDRELNTLVPTQRLWSRINDSIADEKSRVSIWQKAFAFLTANLTNPSFAAAGGILIILGMFAFLWVPQADVTNSEIADLPNSGIRVEHVDATSSEPVPPSQPAAEISVETPKQAIKVKESRLSPRDLKQLVQKANFERAADTPRAQQAVVRTTADEYMPGEESYVKTIANLKQNIDGQKDTLLTPSTRVSYERDMAVVDDSIKRMRDAVRKNPNSQAARQVLYSSYQDKIDLLNSVAQREELLASIR